MSVNLINAFYSLSNGNLELAAEAYASEELSGVKMFWAGAHDKILGRLARLLDRPDDAAGHFEESLNFCKNGPFPTELAWAQYHYADFLLERDEDRDREKAAELQDEAIATAQELDMNLLLELVLAQRSASGGLKA